MSSNGPTEFIGYDNLEGASKIIAIVQDSKSKKSLKKGETGSIIVQSTPFYGEMGGQVGDTGYISNTDKNEAEVTNTVIPEKGLIAHNVKVVNGSFSVGDKVDLEVDAIRRSRIERNHSATHILHWALREVLGDHVNQAGSFVAPERLRFDFTHFEAMTTDEIKKVEQMANEKIMRAIDVEKYNTTLTEARKSGVTALFGEKYDENVRVVKMGGFSSELCGGCHVKNTAEIGFVKITSENSVGANARRIEACTSYDAYNYTNDLIAEMDKAASLLKGNKAQLLQNVSKMLANVKELKKELEFAHSKESTMLRKDVMEGVEKSSAGFDLLIVNCEELGNFDIKEY